PNQVDTLKPCTLSLMLGTLGSASLRLNVVTPSASSLPDWICGSADARLSNTISTWPDSSAAKAGLEPWNGVWSILVLVSDLNISAEMWPMLPLPPEPYLAWFGFFLRYCTSSGVVLMPSLAACSAFTTSTLGVRATRAMGLKSLSGLYGKFLYSHGLTACVATAPISTMLLVSGDLATRSAPVPPPAPGLFSTVMVPS